MIKVWFQMNSETKQTKSRTFCCDKGVNSKPKLWLSIGVSFLGTVKVILSSINVSVNRVVTSNGNTQIHSKAASAPC